MSFAAQTWTIDTASSPWVYSDGIATTVSGTAETISFTATDTGDGGVYWGAPGQSITLADGNELFIEGDKDKTQFRSEANGATYNCGSIWVRVNNLGPREEVKITTMTVTDGDAVGANNLAAITFEYPGKPYKWSWTNINTA
jgi:hypothetical protein